MSLLNKFFNSGIYKNNLKRFKWGSFLYFVILFISGPIPIIMQAPNSYYFDEHHIIAFICAIYAVPVVCAVILFRFLHSKSQTDMIHSLPPTRKSLFVTGILSCITLLWIPIILNSIIVLILSISYGYAIYPVIISMLLQMLVTLVVLSTSVIAVVLAGNSFAAIAISYIINLVPVAYFEIAKTIFNLKLYGFNTIKGAAEYIVYRLPMVRFASYMTGLSFENFRPQNFSVAEIAVYIILATVLFFASYFIYKKRKSESASEVVAFSWLNPVFKTLITAGAAMLTYVIFSEAQEAGYFIMALTVLIVCFVFWFGLDMIICKTFKVFNKYKGFVAFCFFALAFFVCVETGGLGFEQRVPKLSEIKSIKCTHYHNRYGSYKIEDRETIEYLTMLHKSLVENKAYYESEKRENYVYAGMLELEYELLGGGKLVRRYSDTCYLKEREIIDKLYQKEEFKKCRYSIYEIDKSEIDGVSASVNYGGNTWYIDSYDGLIEAICSDLSEASFYELRGETANDIMTIRFIKKQVDSRGYEYENYLDSVEIFSTFENTLSWIRENGYYDELKKSIPSKIVIKEADWEEKWQRLISGSREGDEPIASYNSKEYYDDFEIKEFKKVAEITERVDIEEIIDLRNSGEITKVEGKNNKCYVLESDFGRVGYFYDDTEHSVLSKFLNN